MSRRYDQEFLDIPIGDMINSKDGCAYDNNIVYKRINGYLHYFVSSDGDVISLMNEEPIILKTFTNRHGHKYVTLSDGNGNSKKCLVHRLMAEAFLSNDEYYPLVRHLNDQPDDNSIDNLAWGTPKDNHADCVRNGHEYHIPVYCFETKKEYYSGADAARSLGVDKGQITMCCQGKHGRAGRYHFCYARDKEKCLGDNDWLRDRLLKRVVAISPDGKKYGFKSRKEAAEFAGVSIPSVVNVIAGRTPKAKGWIFKEGEK